MASFEIRGPGDAGPTPPSIPPLGRKDITMRNELIKSLWRYDAMTGQVDWNNEEDPGREDRDRAAFGRDYVLVRGGNGREYVCNGRIIRFLVEVCGHSYEESLEVLVEHLQGQPHACRAHPDIEGDAQEIRASSPNIIEALFSLKVNRLVSVDDPAAVDYSWRVTRALMKKERPETLP